MASCVTLHKCEYVRSQSREQRRETEERIRKIMSEKSTKEGCPNLRRAEIAEAKLAEIHEILGKNT